MRPEPQVVRWSRWIVEACLLLAVTLTPLYFNIYSARHFEPDKATALRTLVLVALVAAGFVGWFLRPRGGTAELRSLLADRLRQLPVIAVLVYVGVYLVTTATSIVPSVSLWGSYQRLQGAYSVLSYVALGGVATLVLSSAAARERWLRVALAAACTVALYGVLQANQLDPLPWRGDVVTRVASTMGNSIFVAAYLIMMVPFALVRSTAQWRSLRAARPNPAVQLQEWQYAAAQLLHWLSGTLTVLSVIAFSGQIRAADARFWWVFPTAVAVATVIWAVPIAGRGRGTRVDWRPFGVLLSFSLIFGMSFAAGAATVQIVDDGRGVWTWWQWLLLAGSASGAAGLLAQRAGDLPYEPSYTAHMLTFVARTAAAGLLILVVFFTQSRGPWIGLAAGLFVFGVLLLLQLRREAAAAGFSDRAKRWSRALFGWLAAAVVLGGLLIVFNVSTAPVFERLREVPYIGRMGQLLQIDSGTGLVRVLIWSGDEKGGGALGLITSDTLRSWIGWGPESMFVAFTPYYPPSLANVEARGASPDRSHQALLDELVTRGGLGLLSYFLVLAAIAWAGRRALRRQLPWQDQLLVIALLSALTAYVVEGLTGIPITVTQMLFWLLFPLLAVLAAQPTAPQGAAEPEAAEETRARPARRAAVARGRAGSVSGPAAAGGISRWWLTAAIGAALTLGWFANQRPVYADMLFHQAQGLTESAQDVTTQVRGLTRALEAVRLNPAEDFYYLNLGRMLLNFGEFKRSQGGELGAVEEFSVEQLLALDSEAAVTDFVATATPRRMLAAAEAVLERATAISPLNKDHMANLARVSTIAFGWSGDAAQLELAAERYRRVTAWAPNDVTLNNEFSGVLLQQAKLASDSGEVERAAQLFAAALETVNRSEAIDPRYGDTYQRRGDILRLRDEDPSIALADYVRAIELAPDKMASAAELLLQIYAGRPDELTQLRDAYGAASATAVSALDDARTRPELQFDLPNYVARAGSLLIAYGRFAYETAQPDIAVQAFGEAVTLSPDDVTVSRWYAVVLSATLQHDLALNETARISARLTQQGRVNELAVIEELRTAIVEAQN